MVLCLNCQIITHFDRDLRQNKPINMLEVHRIHLLATEGEEKQSEQRKCMSEIHLPGYSLENAKAKYIYIISPTLSDKMVAVIMCQLICPIRADC